MFCPQCGAPNEEDSVFCGNCGAVLNPDAELGDAPEEPGEELPGAEPEARAVEEVLDVTPEPAPSPPEQPTPSTPTSGIAIASLVLGISGLTVFPFLGSILALILGYMARNEIRRRPDEVAGAGLAVAGIVTGWIGVGLTVLGILAASGFLLCGLCGVFSAGTGY